MDPIVYFVWLMLSNQLLIHLQEHFRWISHHIWHPWVYETNWFQQREHGWLGHDGEVYQGVLPVFWWLSSPSWHRHNGLHILSSFFHDWKPGEGCSHHWIPTPPSWFEHWCRKQSDWISDHIWAVRIPNPRSYAILQQQTSTRKSFHQIECQWVWCIWFSKSSSFGHTWSWYHW